MRVHPPLMHARRHLRCMKCGYDLYGIRRGGSCPECGLAKQDTLDDLRQLPTPSQRLEARL
jgi:hypothetical protein